MSPTLLAVDGNSLLHRAFHASARTGYRSADGRPRWAVRGLLSQLATAVDRSCADAVVVGFDDRFASVRRDRWPSYKAQRVPKPATLEEQLDAAVEVLRGIGVAVVVPPGLEADDVLASAAAWAPTVGARTVLATSDRDAFALVDEHTTVLRIIDGGVDASPMLDPRRLAMVTGVRPEQYADLAALRGDASDNLPGVSGIGPKTAARLLAEFGSAAAAFDDAANGGARCGELVGAAVARRLADPAAREAFELNRAAMAMHRDVSLGLDLDAGAGCLPLQVEAVRGSYAAHGLPVLGALRALCGAEVPPQQPRDVDASWRPARRRPTMRFPPLPKPASVQDTLF
jgi:DNA polymerase-1